MALLTVATPNVVHHEASLYVEGEKLAQKNTEWVRLADSSGRVSGDAGGVAGWLFQDKYCWSFCLENIAGDAGGGVAGGFLSDPLLVGNVAGDARRVGDAGDVAAGLIFN